MSNIFSKSQIQNFLNTAKGDILGGIIAAVIALPQALAFGVATGLGASAGIWGAIILSLVVCFLGCKFPLISGPTGPTAIVIASAIALYAGKPSLVIAILAMTGFFQLLLALTKCSELVKFVPYPVISGFMNGVGTILIILQIAPLLGHKMYSSPITTIQNFLKLFANVSTETFALGVLTLAIIFYTPKWVNKIIPVQLLALAVATGISVIFQLPVERIGEISISFPQIIIPNITFTEFIKISPTALVIAIICSAETLLTTLVLDSLLKEKHDPKRVLMAHGVGNGLCGLFGVLPGAGATMRSVAAVNNGATTRFAAFVHASILLTVILYLASYAQKIPLAVLAGILIKIGYDIIDTKFLKVIKYAPKDDLIVALAVFLLTVFHDLIFAIGVGIVLSALLYAKRIADQTNIEVKEVYDSEIMKLETKLIKDFKYKIRVVHIDGQFFFGSATQIVSKFEELLGTKYLILNYESSAKLDISAIFALEDIIVRLKSQHIKLFIVIKNEDIKTQLENHGITEQIGQHHIFLDERTAVETAKKYLRRKIKKASKNNKNTK